MGKWPEHTLHQRRLMYLWEIRTWKDAQHPMSRGSCKLKQQWDAYIPTGMAKIQNPDNIKCWQGCGATGTLIHCWWECNMVQPLWKTVWQFRTKWDILLAHDPAVILLAIHPNAFKTYVHTKTCTQMFITAFFIVAKTWKQPRCPSIGEWVNKLLYSHTTGYYSTRQRNELSSHEKVWKNLKCILLSVRRQSEKATDCMIPRIWLSGKDKIMKTIKRSMVARGEGAGNDE